MRKITNFLEYFKYSEELLNLPHVHQLKFPKNLLRDYFITNKTVKGGEHYTLCQYVKNEMQFL